MQGRVDTKDQPDVKPDQRLPYEQPTIEEVSLQPEEQLLACGKPFPICPPDRQGGS